MKNRFNWVFELLKAAYRGAQAEYLRRTDAERDREALYRNLRAALAETEERRGEFPGVDQYDLFLDEYARILRDVLDRAPAETDLEPLLAEGWRRFTALEDEIRIRLK
ncbi:MAG: hypothetical protein JW958_12755 [Candidatus Eisenbacteria bacterium]|nr:hypothetical protein [Candidatus Eisenbacteria bacterium]